MLPHLPRRFCAIIFATCIFFTIALLSMSGEYLPKSFRIGRSYQDNRNASSQIREALSSDTYYKIENYASVYVLRRIQAFGSGLVLIPIEESRNYWFFRGVPDLDVHAFALSRPTRIKTLEIENGLAKLSFADEPADKFSRRLRESRFLECNRTIAESVKLKFPNQYNATPVISDNLLNGLAYFRDLLLKLNVTPFLSGGTLLGWYRDCGIIPHTTDMDFAAFAADYNDAIEPALRKDKIVKLYWRLGKPDDSLEFSVYYGSTKLDLFFLYDTPDSNESWVGGMIVGSRTKLRWTYPRMKELCTADLKGHLFHVPCNVVSILEADYGPEWYVPHHTRDFVWHESHHNVRQVGHWRKEEWSQVYHLYDNH